VVHTPGEHCLGREFCLYSTSADGRVVIFLLGGLQYIIINSAPARELLP